jgi:plastocyanin
MPAKRVLSAALALLLAVSFAAPSGARALSAAGFNYTVADNAATVNLSTTGQEADSPQVAIGPVLNDQGKLLAHLTPQYLMNVLTVNSSFTVVAKMFAFDISAITAPAGEAFSIVFDNQDADIPHNVAIHQGTAMGTEVFKGKIFNGVGTRTYSVPALTAGTYAFVCTVHSNMVGTLTVTNRADARATATVKPTISGTSTVGRTLTAAKGTWTGYPTPTFTYQWYACTTAVSAARTTVPSTCKKITGATRSTFKLTSAQRGKYVAVFVKGTSLRTTATTWLSKSTAKVK